MIISNNRIQTEVYATLRCEIERDNESNCLAVIALRRSPGFSCRAALFAQCGGERWSVKIGSDPNALAGKPRHNNVQYDRALSTVTVPSTLPDNGRVQPTETTVWVLNATLVKYARSFDQDYHMVSAMAPVVR